MSDVTLTDTEINRLTVLLKESARAKQKRAREVHLNDRADMEAAALADFELRKKLIRMKSTVYTDSET